MPVERGLKNIEGETNLSSDFIELAFLGVALDFVWTELLFASTFGAVRMTGKLFVTGTVGAIFMTGSPPLFSGVKRYPFPPANIFQ